jgi:hypothetical protein
MPCFLTRFCITLSFALFVSLLSFPMGPVSAQSPAGGATNTLSAAESAAGWALLFDGRSLSGWSPTGDVDWKVEDGTITATKGTGFLVTTRPYGNFEFKTDFWIDSAANSGVFFRCGAGNPGAMTCYEANIFDAHAMWPTGSINNVKTSLPDKPNTVGKWNTFEIAANGNHLVIKVNGRTTVDVQDQRLATGPIALQEGGAGAAGLVRFRNVKVRPL